MGKISHNYIINTIKC